MHNPDDNLFYNTFSDVLEDKIESEFAKNTDLYHKLLHKPMNENIKLCKPGQLSSKKLPWLRLNCSNFGGLSNTYEVLFIAKTFNQSMV